MKLLGCSLALVLSGTMLAAAVFVDAGSGADRRAPGAGAPRLEEAKLNIEHNATDKDTGFQGFIDGEGWQRLDVRGPGGDLGGPGDRAERQPDGLVRLVPDAGDRSQLPSSAAAM